MHHDFFFDIRLYLRYLLNNLIPISTHLLICYAVYATSLMPILLRPERWIDFLCYCEGSDLVRPSAKISVVQNHSIEIRMICTSCPNQCLWISTSLNLIVNFGVSEMNAVVVWMCRNVRGTIIESKGKKRWYWLFCLLQICCCLWIYISSNIRVRTLYLVDSPSIQLAQCSLWLSSACSVLRHSMKIAILVQVRAEVSDLATPRYTIDWWGAELFISIA